MMTIESKTPQYYLRPSARLIAALLLAVSISVWTALPASAQSLSQGKGNLRVMTYNVYEGADFSTALSATTPEEFVAAVSAILANVQATQPPARMAAIARQIGKAQPTLVSLQEVTEWKTCPATPDLSGCAGPPTLLYDLLYLVKHALQQQGYSYEEIARVTANELSAPAYTASGPVIVFYTQRSAILARADIDPDELQLSNIQSDTFTAALTVPTVVGYITVRRAWIGVDVKLHDTSFRFLDTQLESFDPSVNYAQGEELLAGLANTSKPVVIAMDSNSKANQPENAFSPTYYDFLQHGFSDAWTETKDAAPGPTCCQDPLLVNPFSIVTDRVDLILLRGSLNATAIQLFGGQASDKTSGVWPSDHLGVATRLGTE